MEGCKVPSAPTAPMGCTCTPLWGQSHRSMLRAYSPTLSRFFQTDPIGYADGMHLCAYVGSDPTNGSDPMWPMNDATGSKRMHAENLLLESLIG